MKEKRVAGHRRGGVGDSLYADLKEYILVSPPKTLIATEKDLCAKYGISRVTTRRVMERLLQERLIHRVKGKGTTVALHERNRAARESIAYFHSANSTGHPYYGERLRGILDQAESEEISLDIIPFKEFISDNEKVLLRAVDNPGAIGIIVPFMSKTMHSKIMKRNPGINMVISTTNPEKMFANTSIITADFREFGRIAADYLLDKGVSRLVYVGHDPEAFSGVRDTAESTGKKICKIHAPLAATDNEINGIVRKLSEYRGWGVVIGDDFMARRLFDAFHALKLDLAEICKVVTLANKGERAPLRDVARVEFDGYEMGVKCVSLLKVMRHTPDLKGVDIHLRPRLIV